MADLKPNENHRSAFVRGWKDAIRAINNERRKYRKEDNDTWQAIGYRHGLLNRTLSEDAIEKAWVWSKQNITTVGDVDVTKYAE